MYGLRPHDVSLTPVALALFAVLGLIGAPAAFAGGLDLPIGDPVTVDQQPEPPLPEEEDPPKIFDEEIPDTSQSVIYVVDRSSSMSLPVRPYTGLDGQTVSDGTRLDFVKTELIRSIQSLPATFTFNIVIYSECVDSWKASRVRATPGAKAEATAWVNAITPYGWTNTGGATARALADQGNKAIVLLSDGAPNFLDCAQSYVGDFDTHRRVIKSSNGQGAVIDTFGIGLDAETQSFMMQVASENGGTFKKLD
jgi:hypothetical protein